MKNVDYRVHPDQRASPSDGVWFIASDGRKPGYGPHYLVSVGKDKGPDGEPIGFAVLLHDPRSCRPHANKARVFVDEMARKCLDWLGDQISSKTEADTWPDPPANFSLFLTIQPGVAMSFRIDDGHLDGHLERVTQNVISQLSKTWPEWMPPKGEA